VENPLNYREQLPSPIGLRRPSLSSRFRFSLGAVLLALIVGSCLAQAPAPAPAAAPAQPAADEVAKTVALDTNETLFSVLAMVNQCGYDVELNTSDPLRTQIRTEINVAVQSSLELTESTRTMCDYYNEHKQTDPSRTLAQYISLALYLDPAPALTAKVKEAEMPPDAAGLIGVLPMLQNFYKQADLHSIWLKHVPAYTDLTAGYHQGLAKMMFETEVYLKLPSAGYLGRGFTVYLDPMGAPSQINARNYGLDYYIVISPGAGTSIKMDQIRHTYLHYLLDPMALKYPLELKHIEPIMSTIKTAPIDENFKNDVSLLVTECMIRAVEARTLGNKKTPESERLAAVQESVHQGYVLTSYFYNALIPFEKDPSSLRNAFGDMLTKLDTRAEVKQAEQIQFVSKADSDVLHLEGPGPNKLLLEAEKRLNTKDPVGAQRLAQSVLDQKLGDPGRALFILAEAATMTKNMKGAVDYFQQALGATQEPKVVAWSHIYLGRIFDLQEDRDSAVDHYKAALSASTDLPEAKAAAQRGLDKAYAPPAPPQNQSQNQNPSPQKN
jgi:tetratricopeptide (TPR) repeat protein